jgi:hypothetical protein
MRGAAILTVSATLLLLSPARASATVGVTAEVVAVGGGVAVVVADGKTHVFSLASGELLETVDLPVGSSGVRFDARRSEFWGGSWLDGPVVWRWSPGGHGPVRIERIPAGEIEKTFALENGERLLALQVRRSEDVEEDVPVGLAKWDGRLLRFGADPPPPDLTHAERPWVFLGTSALDSGFIDLASGRPVSPNMERFSKEIGFFVWRASPRRWVLAESGDGRLLESLDDGNTWKKIGYLTGRPLEKSFFAFEGDPLEPGRAYALIHVEVDGDDRLELLRSVEGAGAWRPVWGEPDEQSEEEEAPGELLFDSNAVWVQRTLRHSDESWSIRLTGVSRSGRSEPHAIVLRLTPPALVPPPEAISSSPSARYRQGGRGESFGNAS